MNFKEGIILLFVIVFSQLFAALGFYFILSLFIGEWNVYEWHYSLRIVYGLILLAILTGSKFGKKT